MVHNPLASRSFFCRGDTGPTRRGTVGRFGYGRGSGLPSLGRCSGLSGTIPKVAKKTSFQSKPYTVGSIIEFLARRDSNS